MLEQTMSPMLAVSLGEITVEGAREVAERFLLVLHSNDDDDEA